MRANRSTVLILSSDPGFARDITSNWPRDGQAPQFVVLDQDLCGGLEGDAFDLAIADVASDEKTSRLREAIASTGRPAILASRQTSRIPLPAHGAIIELIRESEAWAATAALLGREILRRLGAEGRAQKAEKLRSAAEAEATLGRYMSEMRHSVNNALTSVLGNAELLLLEPGLPANVLAEAETIRNMALRLHEVFQRFSSIEKELSVAARESGKKSAQARSAASGN